MNEELETRKLEMEERRMQEEMKLKGMEIELQRDQFAASQTPKGFIKQAFSPVGVAVIVGLIGLIGTAVSGIISTIIENKKQIATLALETKKQEASLILKMAEIQDEKQRASNLLFFAQGGYLKFSPTYTAILRDKAGLKEGQAIPPPVAPLISKPTYHIQTDSGKVTETARKIRQKLESAGYRVDYGRVVDLTRMQANVIFTNSERPMLSDETLKVLQPLALDNFVKDIDDTLEKDEVHIFLYKSK